MLSSLSVAGRIAMAPLPNIQPATFIIIMSTLCLGTSKGVLVAIVSTLASNLVLGHGPWTMFQLMGWVTVAVVTGRIRNTRMSHVGMSVFAAIMGMVYGMVVSLNGLLYTNQIVLYYLAGLPYDISHAMGNLVIYLVCAPPLRRVFERYAM